MTIAIRLATCGRLHERGSRVVDTSPACRVRHRNSGVWNAPVRTGEWPRMVIRLEGGAAR